jgi:hypothetical protein
MAAERVRPSITARGGQPLVAEFVDDDSDEVRYFVDDQNAPAAQPSADAQTALSAIGAWSDLDWEELAESLDRIRHESRPTPPIKL